MHLWIARLSSALSYTNIQFQITVGSQHATFYYLIFRQFGFIVDSIYSISKVLILIKRSSVTRKYLYARGQFDAGSSISVSGVYDLMTLKHSDARYFAYHHVCSQYSDVLPIYDALAHNELRHSMTLTFDLLIFKYCRISCVT